MDTTAFSDWREPLYQSALKHQKLHTIQGTCAAAREFAFLGEYRDAAEQLKAVLSAAQEMYDRLWKQNQPGRRWRRDPADVLCAMRGMELLAEVVETGEEPARIREEYEKYKSSLKKRNHRKEIMRRAAALIAVLLAAGSLLYTHFVMLPGLWQQAQELAEEGDYRDAIDIARKLIKSRDWRKAEEWLPELKKEGAARLIAESDYSGAAELYKELGDDEKLSRTQIAWGEDLMSRGAYEEAEVHLLASADQDRLNGLYTVWSEVLAEEGSYKEAVEILSRAEYPDDENSGIQASRLEQLRMLRREKAVLQLQEAGPAPDPAFAGELGSMLDDVDSLLTYCREAKELGVDLEKAFPDGVEVRDVKLAAYQPGTKSPGLSREEIKNGKVLVFSRVQEEKDRHKYHYQEGKEGNGIRPAYLEESSYRYRLLPGTLFSLPEENIAASWEECTLLLLQDTLYIQRGTVTIKNHAVWKRNHFEGIESTSYYPVFAALDSAAFYRKENPEVFSLVDYQVSRPKAYDLELPLPVYFKYTEKIIMDYSEFWGESDPVFLDVALQEGAAFFEE
ncbi:MAG: hypothetical protein IIY55_03325 [Blautia sp.]|nr:hypothetical protein [Blautia sp.]